MKCEIDNKFHDSTNGCYFEKIDDHTLTHVYGGTKTSIAPNGEPLLFHIVDNSNTDLNSLKIHFSINDLFPKVKCGLFPIHNSNKILTIENYLNEYNFAEYVVKQLNMYFFKLFDFKCEDIRVYLKVKNFFDTYMESYYEIEKNKLHFFRPVAFTTDLMEIAKDWKKAILELLRIVNSKKTFDEESTINSLTLHKRGNMKTCNIHKFLIRSAYHLRCGQTIRNAVNTENNIDSRNEKKCIHFDQLSDYDNLSNLKEEILMKLERKINKLFICSRLFKYLLKRFGEFEFSKMLNFSCCLNIKNNEKLKVNRSLVESFTKIYGRCELLHATLCCPDILINEQYIVSLFELLHKTKSLEIQSIMYSR